MIEINAVDLSSNNEFVKEYIDGGKISERFFDYTSRNEDDYRRRTDELHSRSFQREQLADYFTEVHKDLAFHDETHIQIEKLRKKDSVVVVGGQQAGLLTGPLYTVYKAMSIVLLAKQQEAKLKIPVVPIFWVAGEDHDLDEIRFVYKESAGKWHKHMYPEVADSSSSSNAKLSQRELTKWITEVFASLPETSYTNELMAETQSMAANSITYVDFFVKMMNWMFGKEGLLLLDAHAPAIRKLELTFFEQLINEVEEVQLAQKKGAETFAQSGYGQPIETDLNNSHLFLEINGERRRLDYENELFNVRDSDLAFTKQELIDLLYKQPESFSNNVVTRPLMQEWLLPVLAFISGPGELLYWATLKHVFHHFQLKIPPVVLRYGATFVQPMIKKWLSDFQYDIKPFLEGKMEELREEWFNDANDYPIQETFSKAKSSINNNHALIRSLAKEMDPTLALLSEKNATIIENQLFFLEKKMEKFVRQSHEHVLSKFDHVGNWLLPLHRPQERVFHPIIILNMIGIGAFQEFLSLEMTLDGSHRTLLL